MKKHANAFQWKKEQGLVTDWKGKVGGGASVMKVNAHREPSGTFDTKIALSNLESLRIGFK